MKRRGHSLLELLAVMTAAMTLLATAASLLHQSLHQQSRTRQQLEFQQSALVLARQFRHDLARATTVSLGPITEAVTAADAPPLIRLSLPRDGEIIYRVGLTSLQRHEEGAGAIGPRHEAYRMPRVMTWQAEWQGRLVRLVGRRVATSDSPRHEVEVLAGLEPASLGDRREEAK